MMKELIFYYDIVCPITYIEWLAVRNNLKLIWKPVLLGEWSQLWESYVLLVTSLAGLYSATNAFQVMPSV